MNDQRYVVKEHGILYAVLLIDESDGITIERNSLWENQEKAQAHAKLLNKQLKYEINKRNLSQEQHNLASEFHKQRDKFKIGKIK